MSKLLKAIAAGAGYGLLFGIAMVVGTAVVFGPGVWLADHGYIDRLSAIILSGLWLCVCAGVFIAVQGWWEHVGRWPHRN